MRNLTPRKVALLLIPVAVFFYVIKIGRVINNSPETKSVPTVHVSFKKKSAVKNEDSLRKDSIRQVHLHP